MSAYVSVMSAVAGGIGIPGRISDHATLPRNYGFGGLAAPDPR